MRSGVLFAWLFCLFMLSGFRQDRSFYLKLSEAAERQTHVKVRYVPDYVVIPYPSGDVPAGTGVCTDLVIRAYRDLKIDLQKLVHEDMSTNFSEYPKLWKLKSPDRNIDHRRVPNLMKFFERKGKKLEVSGEAKDYQPGDIVTWNLGNKNVITGITHIGIVSSTKNAEGNCYLIAHNIGRGNELEDMLFDYKIIGHYRYSN